MYHMGMLKYVLIVLLALGALWAFAVFAPREKFCVIPYAKETFYTIEKNGLSSADFIHKRVIRAKRCPRIDDKAWIDIKEYQGPVLDNEDLFRETGKTE